MKTADQLLETRRRLIGLVGYFHETLGHPVVTDTIRERDLHYMLLGALAMADNTLDLAKVDNMGAMLSAAAGVSKGTKDAPMQRNADVQTIEWTPGEPPECGYYLATWLRGVERFPTVSELWFNPTGGGGRKWWRNRGYLDERTSGLAGAVDSVVAWAPTPNPFEP